MDEPDLPNHNTPDPQLFDIMARGGSGCPHARKAAEILYLRYAGDLYRFSWRYHRRLGGKPGVLDHVAEVIYRARRSAATFASIAAIDIDAQRRATLGWLHQIAVNLYLDRVRQDKRMSAALQLEAYELFKDQHRPIRLPLSDAADAPGRTRMQEEALRALSCLSERDQDILLVSLDWYDRERGRFSVPSDVIAGLCGRYAIRSDNYRQIRDRALKKMKEILTNAA